MLLSLQEPVKEIYQVCIDQRLATEKKLGKPLSLGAWLEVNAGYVDRVRAMVSICLNINKS